jgi:hypothetical protein
MDRQDGVAGVVLAGEHETELPFVEERLEGRHRRRQVGRDGLSLARQLGEHLGLLLEDALRLELLGQPGAVSQDLLGLGGVLPEVGVGGLALERFEPAAGVTLLKDDLGERRGVPSALPRGARSRRDPDHEAFS